MFDERISIYNNRHARKSPIINQPRIENHNSVQKAPSP